MNRMNVAFQFASVLCVAFLLAQCEAGDNEHDGAAEPQQPEQPKSLTPYGTDVSWPMQYEIDILGEPATGTIAHRQQEIYRQYMAGCFVAYSETECLRNDRERIAMNLAQPSPQNHFKSAG